MIRIIGGTHRRRLLETPEDDKGTRPLPDRVRESMFSLLRGHTEGEAFADFFSGTGVFGLEAISRGASRAIMVERDRDAVGRIKRNREMLGIDPEVGVVLQADALGPAAIAALPRPTHVILFDPPYPMVEDPGTRARVFDQFRRAAECLDDTGFALIRTPWPFADPAAEGDPVPVELRIDGLRGPETHVYGSTAVHWYMRDTGGPDGFADGSA
jgi:16S rRNA (guanine(966)-N(2))-methyltransferase RsmD